MLNGQWEKLSPEDGVGVVHVYPLDDLVDHNTDMEPDVIGDCYCNPEVVYIDQKTGLPYKMPIVIHNAIDGRD